MVVGRWTTAVLLIGSFFYGMMMEEITQWLIFALWLMSAGIWQPNILQVVWWRFNAWGYLAAWMANLGVSWLVVWILPGFNLLPELPDHIQFWLLMALGACFFLPATFLTKPEPMDRLVQYYVMTRPLGWWGPVHREAVRRGLIEETTKESGPVSRSLGIRRSWTAEAVQEWTREDWIAILLSPLVYTGLLFGLVQVLLMQMEGFALLGAAVLGTFVIYWVIDPKLKAVSEEFEAGQAKFLDEVEARSRWEEA